MNYIEVEIGGRVRGLKFNNLALEIYVKHINWDAVTASTIYATFYAGLCGNCYVKREEPDFTFSDVIDWIDGMYKVGQDEIKKVCDLFAETQQYKDWLVEFEDRVRAKLKAEGKKTKKKMK